MFAEALFIESYEIKESLQPRLKLFAENKEVFEEDNNSNNIINLLKMKIKEKKDVASVKKEEKNSPIKNEFNEEDFLKLFNSYKKDNKTIK